MQDYNRSEEHLRSTNMTLVYLQSPGRPLLLRLQLLVQELDLSLVLLLGPFCLGDFLLQLRLQLVFFRPEQLEVFAESFSISPHPAQISFESGDTLSDALLLALNFRELPVAVVQGLLQFFDLLDLQVEFVSPIVVRGRASGVLLTELADSLRKNGQYGSRTKKRGRTSESSE